MLLTMITASVIVSGVIGSMLRGGAAQPLKWKAVG